MFFKANPKQVVLNKAQKLFGKTAKIKVEGQRLNQEQCKILDLPYDSYYVSCKVNGEVVATTSMRDWRRAYIDLASEIEKSFAQK